MPTRLQRARIPRFEVTTFNEPGASATGREGEAFTGDGEGGIAVPCNPSPFLQLNLTEARD